MKIMHTSDLHGELMDKVHNKTHIRKAFDVWVDTGDFFDNYPITKGEFIEGYRVGWDRTIDREIEKEEQKKWLKERGILKSITKWLDGRPFVSVGGNHDFISLADELKEFGCPNVYEITPEGFDLLGYKWAGFPNINYICGEWNYETLPPEMDLLVQRIKISKPDILVCHSPARGILDRGESLKSYGIGHLTNMFSYAPHNIKHMFFGHVHYCGGKKKVHEDLKITFYNGARSCSLHEISNE